MNVVFIMTDRHNPEFSGCYGNSLTRTPHIDSIAERGTRFEYAYCLSPLCAPSRAAMMAGRSASRMNLAASSIDFMGKIFILQMIAITQREFCTFSGKQPCSCAANATGGASDQHALVC